MVDKLFQGILMGGSQLFERLFVKGLYTLLLALMEVIVVDVEDIVVPFA